MNEKYRDKFLGSVRFGTPTPLSDCVDAILKHYNLDGKLREKIVLDAWSTDFGTAIAKRTGKKFIRENILFVEIDSAPLKHQLSMQKKEIIAKLNEKAGGRVLNEIVFI